MLRVLGPADRSALQALFNRDRWVNVFVEHRVNVTGLDGRWIGGQVWGIFSECGLEAACHAGANMIPVGADATQADQFAEYALSRRIRSSSLVGPRDAVLTMWDTLETSWGPARSVREDQPFLVLSTSPSVEPDPRVRPVLLDEFDILYPASVAMFTEEVGVDPEADNPGGYRARVRQLIAQNCAFAIVEDDEVIFKAEVGSQTSHACQIQGVWVTPRLRGRGISAPALAGMILQVQRRIAPVVTLYVNAHNDPARRLYERLGFHEHSRFATVLM